MSLYFNFSSRSAEDWWSRRAFLHTWWRISRRDRRWPPLAYPFLYRAIARRGEAHLQRFDALPVTLEAMPRPSGRPGFAGMPLPMAADDQIVGTVLALSDARGDDSLLHLAMLAFANDGEVLDRFLGALWENGPDRLLGPSGLAPLLDHGALLDHFHLDPPLHTPYNAPYLPELLEAALEPALYSRLWHLETATELQARPALAGLTVAPCDPARLAADLLPLAQQAAARPGLPPVDALELSFALRLWAASAPLHTWLAEVDGQPAGFTLLQPDTATALRRLRGGRPLWARALLGLRAPARAVRARVLLGAVDERLRGEGIGAALLRTVMDAARHEGWRALVIGPVADEGPAPFALEKWGAQPRQRYALFAAGV